VKRARRRTGRPCRVTGNQPTDGSERPPRAGGRARPYKYMRPYETTAPAAVHTVKDGRRPIAARPLRYAPATASPLVTLRRRWVAATGLTGGGSGVAGDRCEADRRRARPGAVRARSRPGWPTDVAARSFIGYLPIIPSAV